MSTASSRVAVTWAPDSDDADLRFVLDEQVCRQDASLRLVLSGWVLHRVHRVARVVLGSDDAVVASAGLDVHRPRASRLFAAYPNAATAGFRVEVGAPPRGQYWLGVETERGKVLPVGRLLLEERTQPRVLFVHIPKAGGSSVNSYLASHFFSGTREVHVESHPDWNNDASYFRSLDFISGHVPLCGLGGRLNLADYYKLTVIREPFSQVASHLAWIRRLSDSGEEGRFEKHPAYAQAFSRKLARTDLSSPGAIRALVQSLEEPERRLMDNCQIRYLSPLAAVGQVGDEHVAGAIAAARTFERIGSTDDLDGFLQRVASDLNWPAPGHVARENVTHSLYGLDASQGAIRSALEPLVRCDLRMYHELEKYLA